VRLRYSAVVLGAFALTALPRGLAAQPSDRKSAGQQFWEGLVSGAGTRAGEYAFDQLRGWIERRATPEPPARGGTAGQLSSRTDVPDGPLGPPPGPIASPGYPGWTKVNGGTCFVWNEVPEPNETADWSGACPRGVVSGQGILRWSSGYTYIGNFSNGYFAGYGVKLWSSGSRYEGLWRNFRPNGYGVLTTSRGRYAGTWIEGCLSGSARMAIDRAVSSCP
jgi:hypothetical protein